MSVLFPSEIDRSGYVIVAPRHKSYAKRITEVRTDSLDEAKEALMKEIAKKEGKERVLSNEEELKLKEANRLSFYFPIVVCWYKPILDNICENIIGSNSALLLKFKDVEIKGNPIQQYQYTDWLSIDESSIENKCFRYMPILCLPIDGWIGEVLHGLDSYMDRIIRKYELTYSPCCVAKKSFGEVECLRVKINPKKLVVKKNGEKTDKLSLRQLNGLLSCSSISCDVELAHCRKRDDIVFLKFKCKELRVTLRYPYSS